MSSVGETLSFYHLKVWHTEKSLVLGKTEMGLLRSESNSSYSMFSGVMMSLLFHTESKSPFSASVLNEAAG